MVDKKCVEDKIFVYEFEYKIIYSGNEVDKYISILQYLHLELFC